MAKLKSTDLNGNLFVSGQLKLVNPFLISTDSLITNLNADLLDGYHANDLIVQSSKCYDTSTSDTKDGTWTVSIPGITELTEGLTIKIRLKRAGASTCTLNLNGLGAKTVYFRYGNKLTTHYSKESVIALTYTTDAISSGTDRTGWIVENIYDSTNIQQLRKYYSIYTTKSVLYRLMICFVNKDNLLIPANNVSNSIATNKTLTTDSFDLSKGIYYYNATTTVAAGEIIGNGTLYQQFAILDLRYSFNTGKTLTVYKPVYVVVTPTGTNGEVVLASNPIAQTLPTNDDGNRYVFLGYAYDTYRIELTIDHPVYVYNSLKGCYTSEQYSQESKIDNSVQLTGDQNISGIKSFSNKIINTYLQHGVMDIHPENNGTIISYYTNDLGYLFERGGSCVATNITQNNKAITVPADVFDCSPTYWYLSLGSTSDVVQILVKASQVYSYITRGGIGFGSSAWRAKDVKIEVGYSATNTGTASSPDTDIFWKTKINLTGQGEGLVCGDITGPSEAEGGNSAHNWSYMRLTLTNWATINPRIAQIFSVTYNSRGLHNAFLSKNGGYVYGNILPSNNNRYLGNGSENWAAVYARFFYENGTSLADKYLGINGTAKTTNKLVSPNTRPTSANFTHDYINNFVSQRLDVASALMTTAQPVVNGFITTYFWDNGGSYDSQLFIPNRDYDNGRLQVRYRINKDNADTNWASTWKSIPYTSDLDNYTKKAIGLPDNISLDTVTESGFYRLNMNPNFPHAQMIVCRGADTIAQMVFPYDTTRMYVRTGNPFNTSGGVWHDWKQVAFTDNINNGILTLNTNGTGISGSATFGANQSGNSTFTVTLDSSAAGNRAANKVVLAKAAGQIDSDKFTVTSAGTTKSTIQYNTTEGCLEFVFE